MEIIVSTMLYGFCLGIIRVLTYPRFAQVYMLYTGYFYSILNIFCMCMPPDALCQVTCTLIHNIVMLHLVMTSQKNTDDVMS